MEKEKFTGIAKEEFHKLYIENNGFNEEFNKNHPAYKNNEDFFDFSLSGAQSLTKEELALVVKS